jgi:creatinine amidohydrolase
MSDEKVRYAELLPHEFRQRLAQRPVAYLPLGTLEWHGEHLPLGSDGIISEGLMARCARELGGVVMPPIHLGPDRARLEPDGSLLQGMDYADTTTPPRQLDGSCYCVPQGFFLALIDEIVGQLKRAGFEVIFADGHGPSRSSWCAHLEERQSRFGIRLLGATSEVHGEWLSQIDHAARNESSLVMALRPDLADLAQLDADRSIWPQGVGGQDPRDATPAHGEECLTKSLAVVRRLLEEAGV